MSDTFDKSLRVDAVKSSAAYLLILASRLQTSLYLNGIPLNDIHPAESYILHELWQEEPLSQTDLSRRLDVGHATVGKTLRRLERDGYLTRQRSEQDKRCIMIKLTKKGHDAKIPMNLAFKSLLDHFQNALGETEADEFRRSLEKLVNHYRLQI